MTLLNPQPKGSKRATKAKLNKRQRSDQDVERWVNTVVQDMITRRARELFREQGSQPGHDLDNWLQAEAEVKNNLQEVERMLASTSGVKNAETTERN